MASKKTEKDYHNIAKVNNIKWLGPIVSNTQIKTWWECNQGHKWQTTYKQIRRGHGCHHCNYFILKDKNDYYILATKRKFQWLGPLPVDVSQKTYWKCSNGHKWLSSYSNIKSGRGCPYCAGKIKRTSKDYENLAKMMGFIWLGPMPISVDSKTWWQCQFGHKWEGYFNNISKGIGCPYCSGNARKTKNDYHILAKSYGFKWVETEIKNIMTNTLWECSQGHQWLATYNNIRKGRGCPHCKQSNNEIIISNFLSKFNFQLFYQKTFNDCRDQSYLPFDFYFRIAQKQFLIEYDGIQHFEPIDFAGKGQEWAEEQFRETQRRDQIKTDFAKKYGFILIRIPYTEKHITWFLQEEIEKYLDFSLEELRHQTYRLNVQIINPQNWKQLRLEI